MHRWPPVEPPLKSGGYYHLLQLATSASLPDCDGDFLGFLRPILHFKVNFTRLQVIFLIYFCLAYSMIGRLHDREIGRG